MEYVMPINSLAHLSACEQHGVLIDTPISAVHRIGLDVPPRVARFQISKLGHDKKVIMNHYILNTRICV
jgi:hypothetical protein